MERVEVVQAGQTAEALAHEVRQRAGDLSPIFNALEQAAVIYQQTGGSLQEAVPGTDDVALGFRGGKPDGRTIWDAYVEVLREELCNPKGELHQ